MSVNDHCILLTPKGTSRKFCFPLPELEVVKRSSCWLRQKLALLGIAIVNYLVMLALWLVSIFSMVASNEEVSA